MLFVVLILQGCAPSPPDTCPPVPTEAFEGDDSVWGWRVSDEFSSCEIGHMFAAAQAWCESGMPCRGVEVVPGAVANVRPDMRPADANSSLMGKYVYAERAIYLYVGEEYDYFRALATHEMGHSYATCGNEHPDAPDGVMYYSPHSTEITDEDLLFLAKCETPVQ